MKADMLNKVKELESSLAKQENEVSKEDLGNGELSKMSPEDPDFQTFIQQMKQSRIRYETIQREEQAKKQSKLKKAKKIDKEYSKNLQAAKEKRIKAAKLFIEKLNSDIEETQTKLGRILMFIDQQQKLVGDKPYLRVKANQIKRMLTAFYYGLNRVSIKQSKYEDEY